MSIGKRLAILVAVAMLGLAGGGFYGVGKLRGMQGDFDQVTQRALPAMLAMNQISDNFKETRALLLALLMEDDADLGKAFQQNIRDAETRLRAGIAELGRIEGLAGVAQQLQQSAEGYARAVAAASGKAGNREAAQLDLYTQVIPAERKLGQLLQDNQQALLQRQRGIETQVASDSARAITLYIVAMSVGVVVLGLLGFVLYRSVMRPLGSMTEAMTRVANQLDFTEQLEVASGDELGQAVAAFNRLLLSMQDSLREIVGSMDALAGATGRLRQTSHDIQHISTQTSDSSSAVAQTLQAVSDNIREVAQRTEDAERLARESGQQASHGGETIRESIEEIRAISETVHSAAADIAALRGQTASISSVVGVITEVAEQTNLLALNAAIEAARAGEQGRGFAVVADEVRKLAERTAQSTQQISQLIAQVQRSSSLAVDTMQTVVSRVESGVDKASNAIEALSAIRSGSENVLATVSEIAAAIRNQREATTEITREFESLREISQEASRATGETTRSTGELDSLAARINATVKRYRIRSA